LSCRAESRHFQTVLDFARTERAFLLFQPLQASSPAI
jgi:hypothetical protein